MKNQNRKILFSKALDLLNKNEYESCINEIESYKKYNVDDELLNLLAVCYTKIENKTKALNTYEKAINLNPENAKTFSNLGILLNSMNENEFAMEVFIKAIQLDPANDENFYNCAVALERQGKTEAAIELYSSAIKINPENYRAVFNRSLLYLKIGDYEQGFRDYEYGFHCGKRVQKTFNSNQWDGSDLKGKRILVYSDQGYGDTIQYLRFLKQLKNQGAEVNLFCYEKIKSLIEKIEFVDEIVTSKDEANNLKSDFYAPLLSLPFYLNTSKDNLPRAISLEPSKGKQNKWKELLEKSKTKKIGIVWKGNPNHSNDKNRSIDFEEFCEILKLNNAEFYNLQIDATDDEKGDFAKYRIKDYTKFIDDFDDTAALVQSLDLVITVDTAAVHLAASLNKTVWLLLPFVGDWRWMENRSDSIWYKNIKIFRQPGKNDWNSVLRLVKNEIKRWK